jgi:hypothetical protein
MISGHGIHLTGEGIVSASSKNLKLIRFDIPREINRNN